MAANAGCEIMSKELELAKEEFGDKAFKRFGFAYMGDGRGLSNPLCNSDVEFYDCPIRPLPELYSHDVEFYDDNAYLMWEYKQFFGGNDYADFLSDYEASNIIGNTDYIVRRKESVGLPFDLKRAIAGDVVEALAGDSQWWIVEIMGVTDNKIFVKW